MNKFVPRQPDPYIKKGVDQEIAKFGHLNAIVDFLNNIAPGGVVSVNSGTGITVDNTDVANPVINFTGDSDDVNNNSSIIGTNVTEALDNLLTGFLPPGAVIIEVDAVTNAALAASIYNNGAGGVGSTITMNTNGVFPSVDSQVSFLNMLVGVKNFTGANRFKNGVYRLTTLGTAGSQAVLTRPTIADSSSELTDLVMLAAYNTGTNKNKYFIQATDSPTVGTSSIIWGAPGAGANLNLTQVLTNGDDAGGLNILNVNENRVNDLYLGQGSVDNIGNIYTYNGLQILQNDPLNNSVTLGNGGNSIISLSYNAAGSIALATGQVSISTTLIDASSSTEVILPAKVGIGGVPNSVAALDIQSTVKGVKFPSQTTAQRQAIVTTNLPGIIVYDVIIDGLFCTNNAGNWVQL